MSSWRSVICWRNANDQIFVKLAVKSTLTADQSLVKRALTVALSLHPILGQWEWETRSASSVCGTMTMLIVCRVCLCYLDSASAIQWHQRFHDCSQCIACRWCRLYQLSSNVLFVQLLFRNFVTNCPALMSLLFTHSFLFIQSFNQNCLAAWSHCFHSKWVRINCIISVAAFWKQIK